ENIIISVVGDTTASDITQLIDKSFAKLPEKYTPDTSVADVEIPRQADTKTISHDIPQTMVIFGLPGLKRPDPDYIAGYVMNYIIGGNGLSSRLGNEIRVKRGLAYTVRTQLEPKVHTGALRGIFSTRNDQAKNALDALKSTLADYMKSGVSQAELDD